MKKTYWICIAAGLVAVAAYAQEAPKEPKAPAPVVEKREFRWVGRPGLPDLTEDQQKQIDKLKLDLEKAVLPLETQLGVKAAELKALVVADNPNAGAVNAKLDDIGALRTQIHKKRVANRLEVRKLLTPEQRVAFDRRALEFGDRMERFRGRMQQFGGRAPMIGIGRMGGYGMPGRRIRMGMGMGMDEPAGAVEKEIKIEVKK
jgi:Spy/CpxP family protein refolding chaperone